MTQPGNPDAWRIDRPWPKDGLEVVDSCPYCGCEERTIAHSDVQDWAFYCAPGKWCYWACAQCGSLHLNPRPTSATIGQAYGTYYTHRGPEQATQLEWVRSLLTNEVWSHSLGMDLRPRLHLPFWLQWLLIPLRSRLVEPFQLEELAKLPPGRLVDVGCGNGDLLAFARQLGWHAIGLELDPAAVRVARTAGLDVIEGSYARLAEFKGELDCIICSHVLEHVHDPRDMLVTLAEALRPGGVLLLSLPNAASVVRQYFGDDWRGLEAPRHLTIPSMHQLEAALHQLGFTVKQRPLTRLWTAAESWRIRRRGMLVTAQDRAAARQLAAESVTVPVEAYDFVEFVCVKDPHRAD